MSENQAKQELKEMLLRIQPSSVEAFHSTFAYWLFLKDFDVLDTLLAGALDRKIPGDPVWLMLVAASGGLKTELLKALLSLPWTMEVDNLTSRAIISGRTIGDKTEPVSGLAKEANGKVLIIKDFTELLSKERTERGEIISQFRTWYDGSVARRYGTADRVIRVESVIGLEVGVTPAVDLYTAMLGVLGERFAKIRFQQDREESRERARKTAGKEHEMRQELASAVENYVKTLDFTEIPRIPGHIAKAISNLAELTALARTTVPRGLGEGGAVCDIQPEYATRLVKQLVKLAQLLAIVRKKKEVSETEYRTLARIAEDSCAPFRLRILRELSPGGLTGFEVAQKAGVPKSTVYRVLDDMEILRFIDYEEYLEDRGSIRRYRLTDMISKALEAVYETESGQPFKLRIPVVTDSPLILTEVRTQEPSQPVDSPLILTSIRSEGQATHTLCKKTWTKEPPISHPTDPTTISQPKEASP